MKRQTLFTCLMSAFALTLATAAVVQAEDEETVPAPTEFVDTDGDGISDGAARHHAMRGRGLHKAYQENRRAQMDAIKANLTDEQQTELHELVSGLKDGETTREEIDAALGAKLQEFGVTLPENWGQTPGQFAEANRLTEEQRTEIKTLVDAMEADGKTREEIHAAVEAKHTEWGVVMLGGPGGPRGRHPVGGDRLTEEQRTELGTLIESMKTDGMTREEIDAAIKAKHDEWGLEMPRRHGRRGGPRGGHGRK
mgnify:CR=1 FL=1